MLRRTRALVLAARLVASRFELIGAGTGQCERSSGTMVVAMAGSQAPSYEVARGLARGSRRPAVIQPR